jgi:DNA-directed RNA polymerase subunit H (RpoH/RPB5)
MEEPPVKLPPRGSDDFFRWLWRIKRNQIRMIRNRGYIIPTEEQRMESIINPLFDSRDPGDVVEVSKQFQAFYSPVLSKLTNDRRAGILVPGITYEACLTQIYSHRDNKQVLIVYYFSYTGDAQITDAVFNPAWGYMTSIIDKIINQPSRKLLNLTIIEPTKMGSASLDKFNGAVSSVANSVRHFLYVELSFDKIDHVLQPLFRVANEEERKEILTRASASSGKIVSDRTHALHLEQLTIDDPMAKYLDCVDGDIVIITDRTSPFPQTQVPISMRYRLVKF